MVLLLVLVLVLVACGDASSPAGSGDDDPVSSARDTTPPSQPPTTSTPPSTAPPSRPLDAAIGDWVLVDGQVGDTGIALTPDIPITLTITTDRLTGSAGCNTYFTDRVDADFPVGPIGSTLMACAPDVMSTETAFLAGLAQANEAAVERSQLVLVGPNVELRFDPASSTGVAIEGTTWLLDTFEELDTAVFSSADAALTLEDGSVTGSTGCNGFGGSYVLVGDTIIFADLAVTEIGCEPVIMAQEAAVLNVLFGEPTIELVQSRLVLTRGDHRLVYRPAG